MIRARFPRRPGCRQGPATSDRGSVSILSAGVMVLACVLALVAADLCIALRDRAHAQTAADAAALAAAQEIALPSGITPAEAAATYANLNGATLISCSCDAGAVEAVVTIRLQVHLVFLGPDRTVEAHARAVIAVGGA
jgi:secretion/DNA translocation related TadE-like protein